MEPESDEYEQVLEAEMSQRRKQREALRKLERIVEKQAEMSLKVEHRFMDVQRRLSNTTELFQQRCDVFVAKIEDLELAFAQEQQAHKRIQTEVSGLAGARSTATAWCEATVCDLSQLIQSKHEECTKLLKDFGKRCETLEGRCAGLERSLTLECSMAERALEVHAVESPRQTSLIQDLATRMDRLEVMAKVPKLAMNVKMLARIDEDSPEEAAELPRAGVDVAEGEHARYRVKEDQVPIFDAPDHNQRKRLAWLRKGDVITVQKEHRAPVFGGQFFDVYGLIEAPSSGWVLLQYERRCGMVDWIGCAKI